MFTALKVMARLREGMAFQLGAWALAIALCLALVSNVREHLRAESLKADLLVPSIDVRSAPLLKDDYLAVRERVGRAYAEGGVSFNVTDAGLNVKAAKLDDYLQWRLALADVMLSMPGAVWTVKSLCAGEKCSEGAFSATVTGVVRSFGVQQPVGGRSLATAAANPEPQAPR